MLKGVKMEPSKNECLLEKVFQQIEDVKQKKSKVRLWTSR